MTSVSAVFRIGMLIGTLAMLVISCSSEDDLGIEFRTRVVMSRELAPLVDINEPVRTVVIVQNIGSGPTRIFDMRINDRADCLAKPMSSPSPVTLNVGDESTWWPSCRASIVRVNVTTDKGSAVFSLSR